MTKCRAGLLVAFMGAVVAWFSPTVAFSQEGPEFGRLDAALPFELLQLPAARTNLVPDLPNQPK